MGQQTNGQGAGPDGLLVLGQDAIPDIVISPQTGVLPSRVLDGINGASLGAGFPFGPVSAGARIALGDLNGDGVADIVAGRGPGGGLVQLFDGRSVAPLGGGFPFGPGFTGGVFVALGDVNGDGTTDIAVAQGSGGNEIRVFSGDGYGLLFSVRPFGTDAGGVTVAAADFTGDGRADLIAGQLNGALVSIIDGVTRQPIATGAPFGSSFSGGVFVAAGDVNGDGRADAILAPGANGGTVLVYDLRTSSQVGRFAPYGPATSGVRVAAADLTGDGRAEIITGPGVGGGASVRVFSGDGFTPVWSVEGYEAGHTGGVLVAAPATSSLRFTSPAATTFLTGQAGSFLVTTLGGHGATSVSSSGTLPPGVSFTDLGNGSARLSGTPASGSGGVYPLTMTASSGSARIVQAFELTVNEPATLTSPSSVGFVALTPASFIVRARAFPPAQLQVSGALPPGVFFTDNGDNTATLGGTPTTSTPGSYALTLTASNGVGTPATQAFTLTVASCAASLTPTPGVLPPGRFGIPYSQTFVAVPGSDYAFAVTGGALPPGLALGANGALSGTPTAGGTFSFTVSVTSPACAASGTYSIVVGPHAGSDTFTGGVGNTQFSVGAGAPATPAVVVAGSVLTNDSGSGGLTAGPATITTANGGTVAMAANGTFLFTPAVGFAGPSDVFTYTLTDDSGLSDSGSVTIGMSGVVWYVHAAGGAGSGQSHNPFNSMSAAAAAAQPGHTIYVRPGSPAGATVLRPGQTLHGAGAPFLLNGLALPASTPPTLLGTVQLADQVHVSGLSIDGGGGPAVRGVGLTGSATLDGVAVVGGTLGIELVQTGGTVSVIGGTVSGVSPGPSVRVSGGSGTVNVGAAITSAVGRSVEIESRSGGTVTFSGAILDTGAGIALSNNPGAVIAFTGGLALTTAGNTAFSAIGGGTLTITQSGVTANRITTTSGTALQIVNTQIGTAGLTFTTINAGESTLSSGNAVVLENTGVGPENGGLVVTGSGTPRSGGLIRRKTGVDGATDSGIGIYLRDTKGPSFSWMELHSLANGGIIGRNVVGFQLHDSVLTGPLGSTSGFAEGPVSFGVPAGLSIPAAEGLVGPGLIRNSQIQGGVEHNVAFYNHAATMQLRIDRTNGVEAGCQIANTASGTGVHGLHVLADGTAVATVVVDQCRLRNNRQSSVSASGLASASVSLTLTATELVGAGQNDYGVLVTNAGNAHVRAIVASSLFSDFLQSGVRVVQSPLATAASLLEATVSQNTLNQFPGAAAAAIVASLNSGPGEHAPARLLMQNNLVRQLGLRPGLVVEVASGASSAAHLTLTANHIDMDTPDNPSYPEGPRGPIGIAIRAESGQASLCASTSANISHWYPPAVGVGGGIALEQSGSSVVQLERGTAAIDAPPSTVLQANNSTSETSVVGTVAIVENGSCQVPGLTVPTMR